MILQIALKEFKELIRDGRFRMMSSLVVVLLLTATFISYRYYLYVNDQHRRAKENARNVWVSQDNKNPHSAAHYGTYAFKPKYPMSLIDQGVDKYAGLSIYLEAHKRNEAQYLAAQDQTAMARFGDLTPDFILLFIMPLLIILIGFNAFTREKESGTLRMLQAQGVQPVTLMFGKWCGMTLAIMLVIIPVFVVAAILLSNLKNFGSFDFSTLAILFGFYLLYYVVIINITLAVSTVVKKSNISLVTLLAIWMLACLVMPKVATRIAEALEPYPTQNQFMAAILEDEKRGFDGHDPFADEAKKLEAETLKEYGVDRVEDLPFNWDGFLMQKGEEHTAEIYFRHYERLKEIHAAQSNIYRVSSILSPFLPAKFLSMAMCRTDYQAHWDFSNAAERYRLMMMDKLNMHFAENSSYGDWDYKANASLWKDVPDFTYDPVSDREILRFNGSTIGVLFGWVLLSFVVLYIFVSKMKII